jgi:hypothetical protein
LVVHESNILNEAARRVRQGEPTVAKAAAALKAEAERVLGLGPFTITEKTQTPPSGDKRDYMSLGPYWWPNPATPDGLPYVRRDGEENPACADFDRPTLESMTHAVETLALGWFLFGEAAYAERAARLLRVFFLEPALRMNPNLNFGQAIPGKCDGRGIGIIETTLFASTLVDAILLLRGSPALPESEFRGLQYWFAQYLAWLLESPHGRKEREEANNHGSAFDFQIVVFARFTGQDDLAREVLAEVPARRFATQIEPDGRQPHELGRTRAMDYATMNLKLFFGLASAAIKLDMDLWRFETSDGRGVRRALDWLVPFWTGAQPWPYKQITPFAPEGAWRLLRQAARVYSEPAYLVAANRLPLPPDRVRSFRGNLYDPPPMGSA